MKNILVGMIICLAGNLFALEMDSIAPTFKLMGTPQAVNLKDIKDRYIVLEWYNEGCPFVRKHYDSKNMQGLQRKYKDNVTWLTLNSSAEGRQGFLENVATAKKTFHKEQMAAMSLLLDSTGKVGKLYEAKTTPHMFIIDPKGKLVYQGAIDSVASANSDDIKNSINYIDQALTESLAGKKISVAKTKPYGCSVKY